MLLLLLLLLQLSLPTRKAAVEVLLLMAVVSLGGSQDLLQGGPHEGRGGSSSGIATKRRQTVKRILRKTLQGIVGAPGEATDGASIALRVRLYPPLGVLVMIIYLLVIYCLLLIIYYIFDVSTCIAQ